MDKMEIKTNICNKFIKDNKKVKYFTLFFFVRFGEFLSKRQNG